MHATKRLAFDDPKWTKADLLAKLKWHREQDHIAQELYWDGTRGCAVGCAAGTNRNPHVVLAERYGVPEVVWRVVDAIHEHLADGQYQHWPERFVNALPEGADLSLAWPRFASRLLRAPWLIAAAGDSAPVVEVVAVLYDRVIADESVSEIEWAAAQSAAWEAWEARAVWAWAEWAAAQEAWEAREARAVWAWAAWAAAQEAHAQAYAAANAARAGASGSAATWMADALVASVEECAE